MDARKDILVLGVGNLLLKDEGVGVHVVRKLQALSLPDNVEVMDGGTLGFDLIFEMQGRKKVIIIDAVKADQKPGTLYRFSGEDVEHFPKTRLSVHDFDLSDVIHSAELVGGKPDEVVFIGVEPKDMSAGLELSPEVEKKIPKIIELVMEEIKLG